MGLGAFAGGIVKGYNTTQDTINSTKRTAIAAEDAALRKQAGDREQTRYLREMSEKEKQDQLEAEMAKNVELVFGKPATPQSTGEMTGPLDARDARAGTMDGVVTQYNIPAQEATGAGGLQGINLMDPANHGKLMQLESLNFASMMKSGRMKPEQIRAYQEYGRKMEKEGTADAFRQFMAGDTSALDEYAAKNGVKSYSTAFEQHGGYPQLVFKMTREDGTVQSVPASIFAASLGASDIASTMNQEADNVAKGMQLKQSADYQDASLDLQRQRVDLEEQRAGRAAALDGRRVAIAETNAKTAQERVSAFRERTKARASAGSSKAEAGPSYDPNLIPGMVTKTPPMMPTFGKKSALTPDQKPQKDQYAINEIASIGNEYYSRGTDPVEAERIGRTVVENAGRAAMKQLGEKATEQEFVRLRADLIRQAREQLAKQRKEAAKESDPSLGKIPAATQKARDSDRVGILRQERTAVMDKLAKLKSDPNASPDEVRRVEGDLAALDRELGNSAKVASAIRTR